MEEMVLSSDGLGKSEAEKANSRAEVSTATKSQAMTKWEKFLPTMMMRVLLVEADDSTRQIIAALLRKCSYRVAAVPDGLKAWELLKGRPHSVDLILTEVDLPSISGFALLTLVMEHEVCKNIPVIMMSSQDSIRMVYKCMMRGAADYLVKPIRKNELRNLWQHVWRRKVSNANGPQDESVAQRKVEETSENDAASNHSNGNTACIQRNGENADKGSDAQSSCTKPDLEDESVHIEELEEFLQPTQGKSMPSDLRIQEDEGNTSPGNRIDARGIMMGTFEDTDAEIALRKGFEPESLRRESSKSSEARETNNVSFNHQIRGSIDLLNGFANDTLNCKYQNSSSSNVTSKFEYAPTLDLTLRSNSGGFECHIGEKRPAGLGHSNSSAFSRYINRPSQPLNQTSANGFDQERECGTKENHMSNVGLGLGCNSDTPKSVLTLATGQSNYSEVANYCPQQRVFPLPIPVKGIRVSNQCAGYGSPSVPPVFCSQSGSSSMPGPSSVAHQDSQFLVNMFYQTNPEKNKSDQLYDPLCRNANVATDQAMHNHNHNQEHKLDSFEDRGHISPTTDQSASSSFCNGNASHFTSLGYGSACGSNSNVDQVAMVRTSVPESRNEETYFTSNVNSHRSIQREAALTKFRMKRKDRCFDKKVRYESRKKLAEQRPRVKGQFVRQLQNSASPALTDCDL